MTKIKADRAESEKLSRAQVELIRSVECSKERAPHLDEADEAEPLQDRTVESLFDDPTA